MRKHSLIAAVLLGAALLGGMVHAASDPTTTEGTLLAPGATAPANELPLVLSIRALSVGPAVFPTNVEMERVKAPTGAGTSRWPSATTPVGRGVYISVMPACIPGVDEPLWPGTQRGGPARRR